jgi:hypothetical protein
MVLSGELEEIMIVRVMDCLKALSQYVPEGDWQKTTMKSSVHS